MPAFKRVQTKEVRDERSCVCESLFLGVCVHCNADAEDYVDNVKVDCSSLGDLYRPGVSDEMLHRLARRQKPASRARPLPFETS